MKTIETLTADVRDAWESIPAPPTEDLEMMVWGWGETAWRAFAGVAPVDVDIGSEGFHAATPLLDIPPRAAAAYLGPYLLSLLHGLALQQDVGLFSDIVTRAHTITCLELPEFYERVVKPHLPARCREVLADVVTYLASERAALALTDTQAETMLELAAEAAR